MEEGCQVYVRPRDAVMLAIRLEFTMDEFFKSGGVTAFTDNMAGILGIHKADIKVVQVYEGSTIVEFMVMGEEDDSVDFNVIGSVFESFVNKVGQTFMRTPILGAVFKERVIFGNPFGNTHESRHAYETLIEDFKADLDERLAREERMDERDRQRAEDALIQDDYEQYAKNVRVSVVSDTNMNITSTYYLILFLFAIVLLALIVSLVIVFRKF